MSGLLSPLGGGGSRGLLQKVQSIRTIKVEDEPEVEEEGSDEVEDLAAGNEKGQVLLKQLMGLLAVHKKKKSEKKKKPTDSVAKRKAEKKKTSTLPSPRRDVGERRPLTAEEKEQKIRAAVSLFAGDQQLPAGKSSSSTSSRKITDSSLSGSGGLTPSLSVDRTRSNSVGREGEQANSGSSSASSSGPSSRNASPCGTGPRTGPPTDVRVSSIGSGSSMPSGFRVKQGAAGGSRNQPESLLSVFAPAATSPLAQTSTTESNPALDIPPPTEPPPEVPVSVPVPHSSQPPKRPQPPIPLQARSQSYNGGLVAPPQSPEEVPSSPRGDKEGGSGGSTTLAFKGKTVEVLEQLGKGATATVWKASIDDHIVALKTVSLAGVKDRVALRRVLAAEVDMMKHFRHPNVIRYYGQFYSKREQEMQIVLEFVEGGSISKLLQLQKRFTEEFSARVLLQCLQGLSYLHQNNIIHRDFKPDNVLISRQTGKVKLIDFGAATKVLEIKTMRRSTVGTPWYTAPEVINGEEYEYSADIWSLGCTLIEFVTGSPPYSELNAVAALFKMAEQTPPIPEDLSPDCHSFLDSCLQRVAKSRPKADELLNTPFVTTHNAGKEDNLLFLFNNPNSNISALKTK